MRPTVIAWLVSVALVSTAMLVAAYFFTHEPELKSELVDLHARARSVEIACLEGGGTWVADTNADGARVAGGTCEHSEPTKAPRVVASASPADQVECSGRIAIGDCIAASNVKDQLYEKYGYVLPMTARGAISVGHKLCRLMGSNPTATEVVELARGTAHALDISRPLGLAVVDALYAKFC